MGLSLKGSVPNGKDQGCPADDLPLLHWSCQQTLYKAEQALLALFPLLPLPVMAWGLRVACFPLGGLRSVPNAKLTAQTAKLLLNASAARDRLTQGIYINTIEGDATGRIELAFKAVLAAMPIEHKIKAAQKTQQLPKGYGDDILEQALAQQIISVAEREVIIEAEKARRLAIVVDDFPVA